MVPIVVRCSEWSKTTMDIEDFGMDTFRVPLGRVSLKADPSGDNSSTSMYYIVTYQHHTVMGIHGMT